MIFGLRMMFTARWKTRPWRGARLRRKTSPGGLVGRRTRPEKDSSIRRTRPEKRVCPEKSLDNGQYYFSVGTNRMNEGFLLEENSSLKRETVSLKTGMSQLTLKLESSKKDLARFTAGTDILNKM